ncbi:MULTISPECIES: hypothetical protein [Hyphobacterium]|uniref:Uncharacterized protein n=1 Tax=Hyphobacterium vulgare TaxID=1736751 RepID=A0ABV6ZZ55_9PROT
MMILALAALSLTAQDAEAGPAPLLPDGRYVEDMAEGDACAAEGRRYFTLIAGDPRDSADRGRIRADFGTGPIDMALSMTSMHPQELADGEIRGIGVVQARGGDNTRLVMTLLLHADQRYVVGQVGLTVAGGEMTSVIRMEDDPLPHGIAPDGTALESFVYCGTE